MTAGMYFSEMRSPEVAALRDSDRVPVLLLPVDATEPHGPHAPLGTDSIISAGVCARTAGRLLDDPDVRVLVLPPICYGVTKYAESFPGGISISGPALRTIVVDVCASLAAQGLHRIVLVNNHFEPGHVSALRQAAETARSEHGARVGHLDLTRGRNARRLTEEFRSGQCHAGSYETSLVLAEHPGSVDTVVMRELPPVGVDMTAAIAEGLTDFRTMGMDDAYCGSPASASAEEGESTYETLVTMLTETVRELCDER